MTVIRVLFAAWTIDLGCKCCCEDGKCMLSGCNSSFYPRPLPLCSVPSIDNNPPSSLFTLH